MNKLAKQNEFFPVAKLMAINTGIHAKQALSDSAGGLINTVFLCVEVKVMLTSNLAVEYGLFNGSIGFIKDIIYLEGRKPSNSLPDVVMVDFPLYKGPAFVRETPTVLPIVPVERRIDCFCKGCKRKNKYHCYLAGEVPSIIARV
ncbi:hypothetical protein ACF0H5_013202 [Mactra antiquata]